MEVKKLISMGLFLISFSLFSQDREYTFVESSGAKLDKSSRLSVGFGLSFGGGNSDMSYIIAQKAPGLENSDIVGRNYQSNLTEFNVNTSLTYSYKNIFIGGLIGIGSIKSSNDESTYTNSNGVSTQRIDEDQAFPKSRTTYGGIIGYDLPVQGGKFYISPEFQFLYFNLGPNRSFFESDQFSDDTKNYNSGFKNRNINKFMLNMKFPSKGNRLLSVGLSYQIHNYEFESSYLKEEIDEYNLDESIIALNIGYQLLF